MIGNKVGKLGEDIVEKFLKKHNFNVFTRNYLRKYGEIDIVAEKNGLTHFIEVKSVSREILNNDVLNNNQSFRPEDNLHFYKLKRLSRVIQSFILSNGVKNWQFDLYVVFIDRLNKKARIKVIENLILEE